MVKDNRTSYRNPSLHAPHVEFAWDMSAKLYGPESVVLGESVALTGYTGGGTQLSEAEERSSSSCGAAGRSELSWLQHNCTNPHSLSEKPRDSASKGFSGRSPLSTAAMGERARIWWNGWSPVRTWVGKSRTIVINATDSPRISPYQGHNSPTQELGGPWNQSLPDLTTPGSSNEASPPRKPHFRRRESCSRQPCP